MIQLTIFENNLSQHYLVFLSLGFLFACFCVCANTNTNSLHHVTIWELSRVVLECLSNWFYSMTFTQMWASNSIGSSQSINFNIFKNRLWRQQENYQNLFHDEFQVDISNISHYSLHLYEKVIFRAWKYTWEICRECEFDSQFPKLLKNEKIIILLGTNERTHVFVYSFAVRT